jgi:hypothetical protein
VSHILDVKSSRRRSLPAPIYGVSPDATWAVFPDFRRLHDTRPGYGYNGIPDPNKLVNAPDDALAWAWHPSHGSKFYLYEDRTDKVEAVGPDVMTVNGHCTYLPNKRWVLNDTYPDAKRNQNPYLYDVQTGSRVPLGHFFSSAEYAGEFRCDTHPRYSPDGKKVVIDSPHGGNGRQMYLFDISAIV